MCCLSPDCSPAQLRTMACTVPHPGLVRVSWECLWSVVCEQLFLQERNAGRPWGSLGKTDSTGFVFRSSSQSSAKLRLRYRDSPCPPHAQPPPLSAPVPEEALLERANPQRHPEAMGHSRCHSLNDLGQMYEDLCPSLQGHLGQSHRPDVLCAPPTFPSSYLSLPPTTTPSLGSTDRRLALGGLCLLAPVPWAAGNPRFLAPTRF